jgi:hypothetical protein
MKDMTDKQVSKIFEQCIDEMYRNSEPSNTWAAIKKFFGKTGRTFHDKHFITEESYNKIREKYMKKLTIYYQRQLSYFLLNYSPTIKENK